ncbi:unnamed protein product [Mortierella alpina]
MRSKTCTPAACQEGRRCQRMPRPPHPHPTRPPSPTRLRRLQTAPASESNLTPSLSFLDQPPLSQPHSYVNSQSTFSSSLVREQSLALGNLEHRQSFDSTPVSPVASHTQSNISWGALPATDASSSSSPGLHIGDQQPYPRGKDSKDRDSGDRSPPSGLSLLLKTNEQEAPRDKDKDNVKAKDQARPNEQRPPSSSGSDQQSEPQSDQASGSSTSRARRKTSQSPPPAPIDTLLAKHGSNVDTPQTDRVLASKPKNTSGNAASSLGHQSLFGNQSDSTRTKVLGSTAPLFAEDASSSETDRLLPRQPSGQSNKHSSTGGEGSSRDTQGRNGYSTITPPISDRHAHEPQQGDEDLSSIWREFRRTRWTRKVVVQKCLVEPLSFIPAVLLGLQLNLLDAVSYGMIIFPLNMAPFQALGPDGISMFFVSCVVSQLVYSLGGSAFKGGNGSMMIEVVPFLHLMAETVVARVGAENRDAVLATTILAYALSTLMTGAVFLALGYFKLGSLIAFFPRHILVGCIGGVGWFLIITGLEVSARMTTELTYSLATFKFLFMNAHVFALWSSAFGLALLLRALQHKIKHPFLVPDNIDTNRELVAHGWSNLLSGGVGTVQNYLVYTNSLLFIKSGGDSRVAGVMLAVASLVIFLIGPWIVGYIPVMVVGSLIFHLGLDLVKEALWDTWGLVHRLEYLTILLIVVTMAGFGFVEGIFLGILVACVFFVVTNSRREGVRYSCTGESAKSTVRRVYRQQKFLRQVGRQIYIFKLQGDMFFGTINKVEKEIQEVFSRRRWEINPIQFLVLDFSLVRNVDFSAAEGFGRIRRAMRAKSVHLILSGLDEDGEVGKALQMVGVWGAGAGAGLGEGHGHGQHFSHDGFDTHSFPGLSEALEYCENCLLERYYRTRESTMELAKRKRLMEMANQDDSNSIMSPDSEATHFFSEHMQNSPRKSHLFEAAQETLHANNRPFPHLVNLQQPVPTLLAAFHDTRENPTDFFLRLSFYFERRTVLAGTILWRQGGLPTDGLYLVEDGTLRSVQEFQDSGMVRRSTEVILPGTISGEMGLFTGNNRSSTLVAETDGILWNLSQEKFQKMVKDEPALAVEFMRVAMSYSAERLNTMAAYAFSLS